MAVLQMSDMERIFNDDQGRLEIENLKAHPGILKCFRTYALEPVGAFTIAQRMTKICRRMDMRWYSDPPKGAQRAWNLIGHFFMRTSRLSEAIIIFKSLYYRLLQFQNESEEWLHKAQPLVKISDCYFMLNYRVHAKRYFMYTLCEDAIERKGKRRVEDSGVYDRVFAYRMSDELVTEYHHAAYKKSIELDKAAWFPERLFAELDHRYQRWITEYPTVQEYGHYRTNPVYIQYLIKQLGTDKGESLERLAHYLVSMIPGSRVYRRRRTPSSDYDVVESFEGPGFRFPLRARPILPL
jgi:hypothetical protein